VAKHGEVSRGLRTATGESVGAFCRRTGIAPKTLARIWAGRPVSPRTFDRFARGMRGIVSREVLRTMVVVRGVDVPHGGGRPPGKQPPTFAPVEASR